MKLKNCYYSMWFIGLFVGFVVIFTVIGIIRYYRALKRKKMVNNALVNYNISLSKFHCTIMADDNRELCKNEVNLRVHNIEGQLRHFVMGKEKDSQCAICLERIQWMKRYFFFSDYIVCYHCFCEVLYDWSFMRSMLVYYAFNELTDDLKRKVLIPLLYCSQKGCESLILHIDVDGGFLFCYSSHATRNYQKALSLYYSLFTKHRSLPMPSLAVIIGGEIEDELNYSVDYQWRCILHHLDLRINVKDGIISYIVSNAYRSKTVFSHEYSDIDQALTEILKRID